MSEVGESRTVRDSATTRGRVGYGLPSLIVAAIALIAAAVWFMSGTDAPVKEEGRRTLRSRKIIERKLKPKKERKLSRLRKGKDGKKTAKKVDLGKVKPDFLDNPEEIRKLTEEMKKMVLDLQNALDLDDRKKVYALVHKLQLMDEWPDGIPKSVKLKALQALSWFGAEGMAEAIGFLADSDVEIRESAVEEFERMFTDSWSMGDIKLAETMVQAVKVISDTDALDSFYDQFSNMRDTVKAETALKILDGENRAAAKELESKLDEIFDTQEYEVKTREDVEKFLKDAQQAYKDDPQKAKDDEEMYGPTNWDW